MKAKTKNTDTVVKALRLVLADSYALLAQTHICHWNVRGPSFFGLHTAFEAQYTELFAAIDVIAERIRALDSLAPGGLTNLAKLAGIKEIAENSNAKEMVTHLLDVNRKLVTDLVSARNAAEESGDSQTEDLMVARIQSHEKTIWMLNSYLS